MNDFMAGPAFTPGIGISYGPGPMNPTGRWTPNGMPGSSWDNPFGTDFQMSNMGGLMQQQPMQPMGQEFDPGYGGGDGGGGGETEQERSIRQRAEREAASAARADRGLDRADRFAQQHTNGSLASRSPTGAQGGSLSGRKAQPVSTMGFGGAFANGGIAPAGKVSLVGERGPELIMPTGPTKVVPMPSMRLIEAQKQNAIAGQNQRDLDAKFGAQPQGRRSIDAAFTDNSLSGRASARDGAVRTGSLSERGATPVGSGRMTPERRMQMLSRRAWTRGDDSAVANLTQATFGMQQPAINRAFQAGQQGAQQDFMRERDATNHAQGMQMWNLDRSFQLDAEGRRNQAALDAEGRRDQRGDAEWMRGRDAELEDRKNSAIDAPFTMTDPSGKFVIPGVKTRGGDFKPMGDAYPVHTPTTTPKPGEIAKHISDNMAKGIIADWDGKSFRYSPIKPDKPADQGSESTVYDDAGSIIQRTVRTPKGASGGSPAPAPSKPSAPSSFLNRFNKP